MTRKKLLAVLTLCAMMLLMVGLTSEAAYAQDSAATKSVDKNVANRRGVSDSLAKKKEDDGKGPNKTQMAVGIGSIFVMIIVMKWL